MQFSINNCNGCDDIKDKTNGRKWIFIYIKDWFQNMKVNQSNEKAVDTVPSDADQGIKLTISSEGIDSYQKQIQGSGMKAKSYEDVVNRRNSIKQASKSIIVNYHGQLAEEVGKLKGQRESGSTYSLADKAEDYVKAYGNLYDEIVQGYKDGTRHFYVEDENSETGYRQLTMEEELSSLDKAYKAATDKAETDRKALKIIEGGMAKISKVKGAGTSATDSNKTQQVENETGQDNIGQKMVTLAQAWKEAYQVSGSKDNGMEKVLSMLNDMFRISNKA